MTNPRWRVEDLSRQADVSVDTIRFYQKRRLLPAPERDGRIAWYGPEHLERLARIRELRSRGLTLALIARMLDGELDATDASRALALGLVNRVVPADQVVKEATAIAERIGENSPIAVRMSRRLVREAGELSEAEGWQRTLELMAPVFASGDAVEGATAFAEKRAPVWKST